MGARERDERLGLGELSAQPLTDARRGGNSQFPRAEGSPRAGHGHRAEDWEERLWPEIARPQRRGQQVALRAGSGGPLALPEAGGRLRELLVPSRELGEGAADRTAWGRLRAPGRLAEGREENKMGEPRGTGGQVSRNRLTAAADCGAGELS